MAQQQRRLNRTHPAILANIPIPPQVQNLEPEVGLASQWMRAHVNNYAAADDDDDNNESEHENDDNKNDARSMQSHFRLRLCCADDYDDGAESYSRHPTRQFGPSIGAECAPTTTTTTTSELLRPFTCAGEISSSRPSSSSPPLRADFIWDRNSILGLTKTPVNFMLERSPVSWARNCTRASAERPTIALDTLLECCDASDKRRLLSLLLGAGSSSSSISDGTQPSSRGLENLHRNLSQNDDRNKKVASFVPLASAAAAADAKERLLPLIRPMLQILQPLPLTSDAQPNGLTCASDVFERPKPANDDGLPAASRLSGDLQHRRNLSSSAQLARDCDSFAFAASAQANEYERARKSRTSLGAWDLFCSESLDEFAHFGELRRSEADCSGGGEFDFSERVAARPIRGEQIDASGSNLALNFATSEEAKIELISAAKQTGSGHHCGGGHLIDRENEVPISNQSMSPLASSTLTPQAALRSCAIDRAQSANDIFLDNHVPQTRQSYQNNTNAIANSNQNHNHIQVARKSYPMNRPAPLQLHTPRAIQFHHSSLSRNGSEETDYFTPIVQHSSSQAGGANQADAIDEAIERSSAFEVIDEPMRSTTTTMLRRPLSATRLYTGGGSATNGFDRWLADASSIDLEQSFWITPMMQSSPPIALATSQFGTRQLSFENLSQLNSAAQQQTSDTLLCPLSAEHQFNELPSDSMEQVRSTAANRSHLLPAVGRGREQQQQQQWPTTTQFVADRFGSACLECECDCEQTGECYCATNLPTHRMNPIKAQPASVWQTAVNTDFNVIGPESGRWHNRGQSSAIVVQSLPTSPTLDQYCNNRHGHKQHINQPQTHSPAQPMQQTYWSPRRRTDRQWPSELRMDNNNINSSGNNNPTMQCAGEDEDEEADYVNEDEDGDDFDESGSGVAESISLVPKQAGAHLSASVAEQMSKQASNFVLKSSQQQQQQSKQAHNTSGPHARTHTHNKSRQQNLQVRRTLRVKIKKSKPILGIAIEGGYNVSGQLLPRIVCVHEDGAAYQCGKLRASDLILEVNGVSTVNMTHNQIAKTIANAYYQSAQSYIEFLIGESVPI